MAESNLQEEQTELLRALVGLMLDANYESTKEKAEHLSNYDFTLDEMGGILNRSPSTISEHLNED